jgi:protein-disulfide isomerase
LAQAVRVEWLPGANGATMATRWSTFKSIVETAALVIIAMAIVYTAMAERSARPSTRAAAASAARPAPPLPTEPISLADAQTNGSAAAKVALVVYSDFQCPFCARFARDILPTLEKQYVESGKVLLAFRQFPLEIHPFAEKAAEGSLCAARQGKFWKFHDDLFADPQALDPTSLQARAERLGLKTDTFATCLSGETAASVESDKRSGQPFGITGTPTFLLGSVVAHGRVKVSDRFSGALPIVQFQTRLDSLLRKAGVSPTVP